MTISKYSEITSCEVCGCNELQNVLNLGLHPMCDDLIQVFDKRVSDEYPIEILLCKNCITAHQRFQVPKENLFPKSYHYRSRFTADVLSGMNGLVESCQEKFGSLSGKIVLDVGCNDGSLLNIFREKGAVTIGIEPTNAAQDALANGHSVYERFLSKDMAELIVESNGKPDFITFTNVFAHIENLQEVIDSLKILMSERTVLVIENHYLGSILDGNQFDTFYHEHPRTYSCTSFYHIASSLESQISGLEFPARYGGNIRVFIGNQAQTDILKGNLTKLYEREKDFDRHFLLLSQNIQNWVKKKRLEIAKMVEIHGKLRAKAFPGRAAILIKLLDLNENTISAVYEKPGSLKIGHYVPGTRIPILSDELLFLSQEDTKPILNLAWHIPTEIRSYLIEHGINAEIVNIISKDDFSEFQ